MKIHCASVLVLCFALIILGCEGKEGPRWLMGPEGPRGPKGPAGSANIIYSEWFSPNTWVAATLFGIHERSYTMAASLLTQEIIDHGVIMVYMKFVGGRPDINRLPITLSEILTLRVEEFIGGRSFAGLTHSLALHFSIAFQLPSAS